MSIIRLDNITKRYGEKSVINGFSLTVEPRDFIAISGPSGSGKSTLLNILGVIETFDEGCYEAFGVINPKPDSANSMLLLRNKISYLFQNFALLNDKTVAYNLEIATHFLKYDKKTRAMKFAQALERVGLSGFEQKKVYQLSGGEQQRIALARIMLKPSELILADEPTGSLDEGNRNKVMEILGQLNDEGKTIIVVTHDSEIEKCAKRRINLQ